MARAQGPDRAGRGRGRVGLGVPFVLLSLLLAGSLAAQGAGAAPGDSIETVSHCVTMTPAGRVACPQRARSESLAPSVAPLRQPARIAPAALFEPAPDLLPAALVRGAVPKAHPSQAPAPVVLLPRAVPSKAMLHRAQSMVRQGAKGATRWLARIEDAASRIRPGPWRTGYDASGWRLTAVRLAGLTPFGGADEVLPVVNPLPGGRPADALRLRWNAGFDGAQVSDFALPGLFASRLLMARYYHGPLFRVKTAIGAVLLPMPEAEPAPELAALPLIFPMAMPARRDPLPGGGEPLTPAPVPLPPAAPLLALPLFALGLAARRRAGAADSPQESVG